MRRASSRMGLLGPFLAVTLLAASGTSQAQHTARRQQWQPQTESDPRLQQPVRIEVMGRAAVPALKLLSEKTGVSLAVAPEEAGTLGERKLTIIAQGCSLKAALVQVAEVLRECHWDVDPTSPQPTYLLHRNAGVEYRGSHEWREQQVRRERRPEREARLDEARRALAMSPDELAELEKTDLLLARSMENPDSRALLELFLSLPADAMETFLDTGMFGTNLREAPASWRPVIEHEVAREYEQAVAGGKPWEETVQSINGLRDHLEEASISFEDGSLSGTYIRIGGFATQIVLWARYPGKGTPDWWYQPMLRESGAADNKAADALFAEWKAEGEKVEAERRDDGWVEPSGPELRAPLALALEGKHEFLEVEQLIAKGTGLSVFSDYFTTSPFATPAAARQRMPAWRLLYVLAEQWRYQWRQAGDCVAFHRADWYDLAADEIPEALILSYRAKLQSQGQLSLDDIAAFSVAFAASRENLAPRPPGPLSNPYAVPADLSMAGISSTSLCSPVLLLYASLSPEQREKARSPAGLGFAEMTQAQQNRVRQEVTSYQNPPPPAEEQIDQAVFRLVEDRARPRGTGVRSYELVVAFPDRQFATPVATGRVAPESGK